MKSVWNQYKFLAIIASVVVVLDQITKAFIRQWLPLGDMWLPAGMEGLMPYARIVHWYNTGVAFGMFQGRGWIFSLFGLLVIGAIVYYYPRVPREDWPLRAAMGLQMGGALGNMIDRVTIGHVTDFISVGTFPVFNVADSAITIGVGVLLIGIWLQERREKQQAAEGTLQSDQPQTVGGEHVEP